MPHLPQAWFLEALGWSLLNSWWQFGILWVLYLFLKWLLPLRSAATRYNLARLLLGIGVIWFVVGLLLPLTRDAIPTPTISLQNDELVQNYYLWRNNISKILPWLSFAYLIWLVFSCMGLWRSFYHNEIIRSKGLERAPVEWRLYLQEMCGHMNIRRFVDIKVSHRIDIPVITGWLKPIILLPVSLAGQLSPDQVEAILIHELAHIKRNDYFWNVLVTIAGMIFFFNPFVKCLIAIIREEREHACDDWVLQFPFIPHDYAIALLKLEQDRNIRSGLLLAAGGNNKQLLLARVQRMLNLPINNSTRRTYIFIPVLFLAILMAGLSIQPVIKSADTSSKILAPDNKVTHEMPVTITSATNDLPVKPAFLPANVMKKSFSNPPRTFIAKKGETDLQAKVEKANSVLQQTDSSIFKVPVVTVKQTTEYASIIAVRAVERMEIDFTLSTSPEPILPETITYGARLPYVPRNSFQAFDQIDTTTQSNRIKTARSMKLPGRVIHF